MAEAQGAQTSRMRAITVSREYGSGGGEVAYRLSQRLGWQLVDHEVVVRVAEALGITESEVEAQDEHADSFVARILSGFSMIQSQTPVIVPDNLATDTRAYSEAVKQVVLRAADQGKAVIVGRGAQALLADRRDVLHIRVIAPLEQRIKYVMQREGLNRAAAQSRIHVKDQDRLRFVSAEYHRNPSDAHLYDLIVNTGALDLDSVVGMVALALEAKARQLDVPAEELGPGAGLKRYPTAPGDFTPAEATLEQSGQASAQ